MGYGKRSEEVGVEDVRAEQTQVSSVTFKVSYADGVCLISVLVLRDVWEDFRYLGV